MSVGPCPPGMRWRSRERSKQHGLAGRGLLTACRAEFSPKWGVGCARGSTAAGRGAGGVGHPARPLSDAAAGQMDVPRAHETWQTHYTELHSSSTGPGVGVLVFIPPHRQAGLPAAAARHGNGSITLVAMGTHPQNRTHCWGSPRTSVTPSSTSQSQPHPRRHAWDPPNSSHLRLLGRVVWGSGRRVWGAHRAPRAQKRGLAAAGFLPGHRLPPG